MKEKNRGTRRYTDNIKFKTRLKRFWSKHAGYAQGVHNGQRYCVNTLEDAVQTFKDTHGKKFRWVSMAKEHHSYSPRRADKWGKYEKKKINLKEKTQAKKQIDQEVYDNSIWFEDLCVNCDNFPGDLLHDKSPYYEYCPFKTKFENGVFNGDTLWKQIGCKNFWD